MASALTGIHSDSSTSEPRSLSEDWRSQPKIVWTDMYSEPPNESNGIRRWQAYSEGARWPLAGRPDICGNTAPDICHIDVTPLGLHLNALDGRILRIDRIEAGETEDRWNRPSNDRSVAVGDIIRQIDWECTVPSMIDRLSHRYEKPIVVLLFSRPFGWMCGQWLSLIHI